MAWLEKIGVAEDEEFPYGVLLFSEPTEADVEQARELLHRRGWLANTSDARAERHK